MVVTPGVATAARRRLAALAPGAPAAPRVEVVVAALALPGDGAAAVRLVRVVGIGVPVLAVLAGGVRLAVLAVLALAGTGAGVRRAAPRRRVATYERELPEVLEAVARQLRAGGSLAQAVGAARPPMPTCSSLPEDWRRMVDLSSTRGIVPALDDWAARAGAAQPSVRLAAAALAMAAETGGSPARAVDGVASTLRSRLAVADEVRALSSQARASALVIAAAPLVFGLAAGVTDARTTAFFASPLGVPVLAAGVGLDAVGAWWMSRLCRAAT